MLLHKSRLLLGAAVLVPIAPVWADDCAQPRAAMMVSAKTPYSETIVSPGPAGKAVTSHVVQTPTVKYVERNGSWMSLPVSSADLVDTLNDMLKTAKMSCKRIGAEQVNGVPTTVYRVHLENQGAVTDGTLWISAQDRQLKSETTRQGVHFASTFDYDHVQPPAGAKPVGKR